MGIACLYLHAGLPNWMSLCFDARILCQTQYRDFFGCSINLPIIKRWMIEVVHKYPKNIQQSKGNIRKHYKKPNLKLLKWVGWPGLWSIPFCTPRLIIFLPKSRHPSFVYPQGISTGARYSRTNCRQLTDWDRCRTATTISTSRALQTHWSNWPRRHQEVHWVCCGADNFQQFLSPASILGQFLAGNSFRLFQLKSRNSMLPSGANRFAQTSPGKSPSKLPARSSSCKSQVLKKIQQATRWDDWS